MKQTLMNGFSGILGTWQKVIGRTSSDDERQINIWKKVVSRFREKLVKMIKDASKFDDYSFSPKFRQILLHLGFELTEKDFLLT